MEDLDELDGPAQAPAHEVSPTSNGCPTPKGGIGFQEEKRDTFMDLLQKLAQEHEREVLAKVAEKAAENARLRFRLFKQASRPVGERTRTTSPVLGKRALTNHQLTERIFERSMTSVVTRERGTVRNNRDLLMDSKDSFRISEKPVGAIPTTPVGVIPMKPVGVIPPKEADETTEKQPVAQLVLPGVPAHGQRTNEGHNTDAADLRDESGVASINTRDSEEDSVFNRELFELRDEWQVKSSSTFRGSSRTPPAALRHQALAQRRESLQMHDGFLKHFISFPGSRHRVTWDLCGALLIFYDMILIPLRVFDVPDTLFTEMMDWLTLIFWTLNIFASLMVGYHKNGTTIMVPKKIALNYLRTWCLMDLVVVGPDWAFTLASLEDTGARRGQQVRLLRILRLVRTVRLLRIIKLRWLLTSLNDRVDSEYTSILLSIFKMIVLLLSSNHLIACVWFLIAFLTEGSGDTWVTVHQFHDASWFYQYLTAFHWSITQFTPASMHVQPQNTTERLFAVAVVVFALVGFSYVVGSITGSLAQIRSMQEDASKQFWNVRRYLRQNQVPTELSVRIQKYLEHAWQKQCHQVSASGIKLFSLLSEQLSNELQLSMSVPHLSVHPLFEHLRDKCSATMTRLANTAISRKLLAQGDSLFYPGEAATHMYFVAQGRLQYIRVDTVSEDHFEWVEKDEDWISEPVLWTPAWVHLGMLNAETESDLLGIDADKFNRIISLNPAVFGMVSGYARSFVEWINGKNYEDLSDIVQGEDVSKTIRDFIPSMEDLATYTPAASTQYLVPSSQPRVLS